MPRDKFAPPHPFKSFEARDRYRAVYDADAKRWPIPSEERRVRTQDGETYVRISGPEEAPPLVLLPGGRTNSMCWVELIEALSRGFRTYAIDAIYDDGRSVSAKPMSKTEDATAWLDNLFDELGLGAGINLMGLSFGGWMTAEYLLHAPDRVAKAVWLAPAGVVAPLSGEFISRSLVCIIPADWSFRWFTGWVMPDLAAVNAETGFFDAAISEMALSEACFKFRPWPNGGPRAITDEELAGIAAPVLYLVGEHERVCKDVGAAIERVRSVAPQIEVEVLPGVGHDISLLKPAEVSACVLKFLEA
jgi:pimeloyl-ACP methyl ester carboxylesterase